MKILHICLTGIFTEGFTYQENLIVKYHRLAGYEVAVAASTVVRDSSGGTTEYSGEPSYTDSLGVRIHRLSTRFPSQIYRTLRRFAGLRDVLESSCPDIVFIHGCQFLDIDVIADYLSGREGVRVYVDNHADFNNSAKNYISKNILHKIIWKRCAKTIEPYAEKFYGVTPLRVDFLKDVYDVPAEKCELLVMGVDDDEAQKALAPEVRIHRRAEYGASDDDFVIVTGGKIDHNKPQVISLMKAVNETEDKSVKLIVFGSVSDELKQSFEQNLSGRVKHIGWRKSEEIYTDFAAADLVAFPGLHSVLWEQAVGMGKPCAFKRIKGFEHIDLGGNCVFFENDSEEEYTRVISLAKSNIASLKKAAEEKGMKAFSYKEIAKRAIE